MKILLKATSSNFLFPLKDLRKVVLLVFIFSFPFFTKAQIYVKKGTFISISNSAEIYVFNNNYQENGIIYLEENKTKNELGRNEKSYSKINKKSKKHKNIASKKKKNKDEEKEIKNYIHKSKFSLSPSPSSKSSITLFKTNVTSAILNSHNSLTKKISGFLPNIWSFSKLFINDVNNFFSYNQEKQSNYSKSSYSTRPPPSKRTKLSLSSIQTTTIYC